MSPSPRHAVRPGFVAGLVAALAAWICAPACGGNVIVDGAGVSGGTGASGNGTGATGTGTGGTTTVTPQTPDAGNAACDQEYTTVIGELESAQGCTPTANVTQCSGAALLHDPCGCLFIANEAHPDVINTANNAYMGCVGVGCCGAGTEGCNPCPPPPTSGFCDPVTSRCLPSP